MQRKQRIKQSVDTVQQRREATMQALFIHYADNVRYIRFVVRGLKTVEPGHAITDADEITSEHLYSRLQNDHFLQHGQLVLFDGPAVRRQ